MSHSDDDDIIVAQTCGTRGCCSQVDLEFNVEEGEYYCGTCRELAARAETEGFHVLLTAEERQVARLIFEAFSNGADAWGPAEFGKFAAGTGEHDAFLDLGDSPSAADLADYFKEEFDIEISPAAGVTLRDLEAMYGGYKYNNNPILDADADTLSEAGLVRLGLLE